MKKAHISIIVPTLNEEQHLLQFFQQLQFQEHPWELILVDAQSQDQTATLLQNKPSVRILYSKAGRGKQMNLGAKAARGSILLFLHVDLKLSPNAFQKIRQTIAHGYIGGGFFKRFQSSSLILRLNEFLLNWIRTRLFASMVGTNGMFCSVEIFQQLGGFQEWPFLEDVDFSDRLKKAGKIKVIRDPIFVSARKYQRDGVIKRTIQNMYILFLFRVLKKTPTSLVKYYQSKKMSVGSHINES